VRHPLSCPSPSHSHSLYRILREWNLPTCKLKSGRVAFLLVEGLFWLLNGILAEEAMFIISNKLNFPWSSGSL
jgi:hypothetical protein